MVTLFLEHMLEDVTQLTEAIAIDDLCFANILARSAHSGANR